MTDKVFGCSYCIDSDGNCAFPYYGLAPHVHNNSGVTKIKSKKQWPDNFKEDGEESGQGVYTECPKCGAKN